MFSQFMGAEMIVKKHGFTKDDLDAVCAESHQKAKAATQAGAFDNEIVALEVETPEGMIQHNSDEGIRFDASLEGIAGREAAAGRRHDDRGNASQICDGASAVLIVSEQALKDHGLTPIARIHQPDGDGGRPGDHARRAIVRHRPRVAARGHEDRRHRRV